MGRIGFRGYTKDDLVEFQKGAITLSPSNIIDGEMDYNKCTYISWDKYEESPEIEVLEGDILLVKTGSSFGKCALVDKLPWKSTINPQFVILKYISINEQYLTWVLQSSYARNNYNDFVLGTAIPTFTQVVLGNMPIPLPPISEQLKIVKKLKHLFLSINSLEDNKKSLCTLIKESKSKVLDLAIHGKLVPQDPMDEPASELLKRITPKTEITCDNGHYQKLPDGWTICTLKNICKVITGSTPSKSNHSYYGGNIPFYKPADLDFGRYVKNASEYLSEEGMCVSRVVPAGSTAVCCIGTIGKVGYLVNAGTTNQQINCAIPSKAVYDVFLYYLCCSSWFYNNLIRKSSAVTISIVNKSKMENIEVPLPPLEEQHRIVAKIEEIFAQLDAIEASL